MLRLSVNAVFLPLQMVGNKARMSRFYNLFLCINFCYIAKSNNINIVFLIKRRLAKKHILFVNNALEPIAYRRSGIRKIFLSCKNGNLRLFVNTSDALRRSKTCGRGSDNYIFNYSSPPASSQTSALFGQFFTHCGSSPEHKSHLSAIFPVLIQP